MNPGQQKFQSFILERVEADEQDNAKALLLESFQKQDEKSFDQAYLKSFIPKMTRMLKPEYVEEVTAIMKEFGSNLTK